MPNANKGFNPMSYEKLPTKALDILPIVPPADINPNANDLTTVGNNSERWIYAKVQTVVTENLII